MKFTKRYRSHLTRGTYESADVLKLEYEQQYQQYRWIGQQQSAFLTFYGVLISASILLFGIFAKFGNSQSLDQTYLAWLGGGLLFYGIIGYFLTAYLISSKAMQMRTAIYLAELLKDMCDLAPVEKVLSSVSEPIGSSFRFRALCTSKGRFKALDTGNIAIAIAFIAGTLLISIGFSLIAAAISSMNIFGALMIGAAFGIVLLGLGLLFVIPYMTKRSIRELYSDYEHMKNTDGIEHHSESIIQPPESHTK